MSQKTNDQWEIDNVSITIGDDCTTNVKDNNDCSQLKPCVQWRNVDDHNTKYLQCYHCIIADRKLYNEDVLSDEDLQPKSTLSISYQTISDITKFCNKSYSANHVFKFFKHIINIPRLETCTIKRNHKEMVPEVKKILKHINLCSVNRFMDLYPTTYNDKILEHFPDLYTVYSEFPYHFIVQNKNDFDILYEATRMHGCINIAIHKVGNDTEQNSIPGMVISFLEKWDHLTIL